jgi:hypothetical protein
MPIGIRETKIRVKLDEIRISPVIIVGNKLSNRNGAIAATQKYNNSFICCRVLGEPAPT